MAAIAMLAVLLGRPARGHGDPLARRDAAARRRSVARGIARLRPVDGGDRVAAAVRAPARATGCRAMAAASARPRARGAARRAAGLRAAARAHRPVVPVYGVLANLLAAPAAPVATIVGLAACLAAAAAAPAGRASPRSRGCPASWIAGDRRRPCTAIPGDLAAVARGMGRGRRCSRSSAGRRHRSSRSTRRPRGRRGSCAASRSLVVASSSARSGRRGRAHIGRRALDAAARAGASSRATSVRATPCCSARQGVVMLVDTGPDPEPLTACLDRAGIARVDLLVLTHFDLDHVGGLTPCAAASEPCSHGPGTGRRRRSCDELAAGGAHVVDAARGARGGARRRALARRLARAGSRAFAPGNDASVVLDIAVAASRRRCSSATCSASPQRAIAASGALGPPYAIVKVAHHGSADQDPGALRGGGARRRAHHRRGRQRLRPPARRDARDARGLGACVVPHRLERAIARGDRPATAAVQVWRERDGRRRRPSVGWSHAHERPPCPCGEDAQRHPAGLVAIPAAGADRAGLRSRRGVRRARDRGCARLSRAEDPSLEVSDLRADDYVQGTLLGVTSPSLFGEPRLVRVSGVEKCSDAFLAEALSYLAVPAGRRDGGPPPHRRDRARQEAARRDPRRRGRRRRDRVPRHQARLRPVRLRGRRVPGRQEAHRSRGAARARLRFRRRPDRARGGVSAADRRRPGRRHRAGRRALLRRPRRDLGLHGRRHGDRRAATARRSSRCGTPWRRAPIRCRSSPRSREAAHDGTGRGQSRAGGRRSRRASASRTGRSTARGAICAGWTESTLGMAIQAAARADAEVKGGSRDSVFALERLVTVIATRAPYGS